jgi:hypothetical protein
MGRTSFKLCQGNSTVWHWIQQGESHFSLSINFNSTFVAVSHMSGDTMAIAASDWEIKSTL